MWGDQAASGDCWTVLEVGSNSFAEAGPKRAVVDRAPNLQQQVGAPSRPSHLLRLIHPLIDQEVGCALGHRSSDPLTGPVSVDIIDEPHTLAAEIGIDLAQRA